MPNTKRIHHYKNSKEKLIKTKAAIWFNKTCRTRHICPKYIHIQVNGNNSRSFNTKQQAVKHRLNLEIKFLYKKKQIINKQLYKLHLENAQSWQKNWHIIQNNIENELKTTTEKLYKHLNSKLDRLQTNDKPHNKKEQLHINMRDNRKQPQYNTFPFSSRTVNFTNIQLNKEEYETLRLGLQYNLETTSKTWIRDLTIETETAIDQLEERIQENLAYNKLRKIIHDTPMVNNTQKTNIHY
jgi:hypothetical protein